MKYCLSDVCVCLIRGEYSLRQCYLQSCSLLFSLSLGCVCCQWSVSCWPHRGLGLVDEPHCLGPSMFYDQQCVIRLGLETELLSLGSMNFVSCGGLDLSDQVCCCCVWNTQGCSSIATVNKRYDRPGYTLVPISTGQFHGNGIH
jgi:hypothetical protein